VFGKRVQTTASRKPGASKLGPKQPSKPAAGASHTPTKPTSTQPGTDIVTPQRTPIATTSTPVPIMLLASSPSPAPSLQSDSRQPDPEQLFTQLYDALRPTGTVFKSYYRQGVSGGAPQPAEMNLGPITVSHSSSTDRQICLTSIKDEESSVVTKSLGRVAGMCHLLKPSLEPTGTKSEMV